MQVYLSAGLPARVYQELYKHSDIGFADSPENADVLLLLDEYSVIASSRGLEKRTIILVGAYDSVTDPAVFEPQGYAAGFKLPQKDFPSWFRQTLKPAMEGITSK